MMFSVQTWLLSDWFWYLATSWIPSGNFRQNLHGERWPTVAPM